MRLAEGEPAAGPWRVERFDAFVARLRATAGRPAGRPPIVAVDGRGSSGKSTLAARLGRAVDGAALVHTDDIAWWHAAFDWADLLADGVLKPLRAGRSVDYRPPKWDERGRAGAIEVPASAPLVVVEGVGAGRRSLAPLLDAVVFVQSDIDEIDRRNAVRVAAGETTPDDFASWMREEVPFVVAERAWERAFAIVCGTPELPYDPATELVVAPPM
jgi:uridine kinase